MLFTTVDTELADTSAEAEAIGGLEGLGLLDFVDPIFTSSAASLASTSFLTVSISSSISQTSLVVSRANLSRSSSGSLVMMMGISKLLYCSDLIPKDASPLILTVILSYTNLKDDDFSLVQVSSLRSSSMCALVICCGFPKRSCKSFIADS